ncbi:hypothetical protein GCM10027596_22190 [Nocardioides korecus]
MDISRVQRMLGPREGTAYRVGRSVYRGGVRLVTPPRLLLRRALGIEATVEVDSLRLVVPDDMRWAYRGGTYYEQGTRAALLDLVTRSERPVFYDVGANAGFFTLSLAPLAHEVHSFEPVNSTHAILSKNVQRNALHNVHLHQLALGEESRKDQIHLYSSSGNNSLHDISLGSIYSIGSQDVHVDTLDRLVLEAETTPPTLIKIDIEGGELDCLRGAGEVLRRFRPVIVCEFFDSHFEAAGYGSGDIVDLLHAAGYDLFTFESDDADFAPKPLTTETVADSRTTLLGVPTA